jgi:hypothetical protein
MPKSTVKIDALKAKLDRLDPAKASRSKNQEIVRSLLPVIEEKQHQGFRLDEIYDVLKDDLTIKFGTFKTYIKQARKEKEGKDDGTANAVQGSGRG